MYFVLVMAVVTRAKTTICLLVILQPLILQCITLLQYLYIILCKNVNKLQSKVTKPKCNKLGQCKIRRFNVFRFHIKTDDQCFQGKDMIFACLQGQYYCNNIVQQYIDKYHCSILQN